MSRKICVVWDFHGDAAEGTAKHHLIHLKEFVAKNTIELHDSGINSAAEFHHLAYITINETDVKFIRDTLKPHRAFVME